MKQAMNRTVIPRSIRPTPARPRLAAGLGTRLDALWQMVGDRGPQCARRPNFSRIRR